MIVLELVWKVMKVTSGIQFQIHQSELAIQFNRAILMFPHPSGNLLHCCRKGRTLCCVSIVSRSQPLITSWVSDTGEAVWCHICLSAFIPSLPLVRSFILDLLFYLIVWLLSDLPSFTKQTVEQALTVQSRVLVTLRETGGMQVSGSAVRQCVLVPKLVLY